ncbi:hypothetical protein [Obesumbacterium proteus]|uniref:hypothetical protein n=1 Tax=Obesumbacterium proteus TaxID=82983 RepID=UPI00242CB240|nr:hypothetical protein [Obesumbacterium proteus]
MSDEKENGSDIHPIIKALDLAWEPSLLIKFLFYCLFIDLACSEIVGHGLWAVRFQDLSDLSIGSICGIFFFWALMLLVLNFISEVIKILNTSGDGSGRRQGSVSPSELLTEAIKTNSYVFYNLHVKARNAQKNRLKSRKRLEVTSLGVSLLIIMEWVKVARSESGGLFVEWIWRVIKIFSDSNDPVSQGWVAFIACLLSLTSVCAVYANRYDFTADYVYCPSLYYKLNDK